MIRLPLLRDNDRVGPGQNVLVQAKTWPVHRKKKVSAPRGLALTFAAAAAPLNSAVAFFLGTRCLLRPLFLRPYPKLMSNLLRHKICIVISKRE